jgi:dipeptidyl aminopeptidase/acylaminoacyl peptidase
MRFRAHALGILCITLTSCTGISVSRNQQTEAISSSATSVADTHIEQVPSDLSLEHFSTMTLVGTGLTLEAIMERNAAYTKYAIHYYSNGLHISGVMNIPSGDGPFPLVILNHGHIDRSVYVRGRGLRREQDYLARHGFAVLHTDYRGHAESDESPMPDDMQIYDGNLEYAMDSANAILAVRSANLPSVDAENVGMLGHSLGGGVTMAVLTGKPDLVDAAVLYAPVHADVWENFNRWRRMRDEGDRTVEQHGTRETNPAWWDELSPQTYFAKLRAPIIVFQGDEDTDVPKAWSDTLVKNVKAAGKDIMYVEYPGAPHEFVRDWPDFMSQTSAFLHAHLDAAVE